MCRRYGYRNCFRVLFSAVLMLLSLMALKVSYKARMDRISKVAQRAQMQKKIIQTKDFAITVYYKIRNPESKFVFYIEGDGLVYYDHKVSDNPTPLYPLTLELAAIDSRPNIVYISRPCQCTTANDQQICSDNSYWTNKRYALEVISSINEVIKEMSQGNRYDLIGYSGGGGIAVLAAALAPDKVRSIVTISANLNHVAFNSYHHALPMDKSLNPIDYIENIKHIPQLHLGGMQDNIVPPFIINEFVTKVNSPYARVVIFKTADHSSKWKSIWSNLLSKGKFDDLLIVNNILLKN